MASKKETPAPAAKPSLAGYIRKVLDSIPDGPFWATYADICLALGRPVSNALAVASAASKVDGFVRWDQVRNSEGLFRAMGDGGRKSTDAAGRPVVHSVEQIAKWAAARKLTVSDAGRADRSQRITWANGVWVLANGPDKGKAVSAKVRPARKPKAAKPAASEPVAPVVEEAAPVVVSEAPAAEVAV